MCTSEMAHDAPPRVELPKLIDLQPRSGTDKRPRLVPLTGPRLQSATISVSLHAITATLLLPVVVVALTDSALRSPLSAHLLRWYTSGLLLLCAIGVTIIGQRPQQEQRRHLVAVVALLGLSFVEAAPRDTYPRFAAWLAALPHYPFLILVMGATVACSALAFEAKHRGRIAFAPALIVYLCGVLAALLSGDRQPEHSLTGLLRSVANLGRMLGPVLAVRAILQYLSPAQHPAALRFVFASTKTPR